LRLRRAYRRLGLLAGCVGLAVFSTGNFSALPASSETGVARAAVAPSSSTGERPPVRRRVTARSAKSRPVPNESRQLALATILSCLKSGGYFFH
jgi:hypothetical protein